VDEERKNLGSRGSNKISNGEKVHPSDENEMFVAEKPTPIIPIKDQHQ
jgi:hypothetical protein